LVPSAPHSSVTTAPLPYVGHNSALRCLIVVVGLGLSGCGRKNVAVPAPSVPPPVAPAPVPAPAPIKPVVFAIPARVTDTRYKVESVADVERDSAGRRD